MEHRAGGVGGVDDVAVDYLVGEEAGEGGAIDGRAHAHEEEDPIEIEHSADSVERRSAVLRVG